ncbi:hypothetical protein FRC14_005387 [Serendipita sp. 396]|nr:hypothetical protein FRC14_005387 [Serendipita sp. 396]
MSTRKHTNLRSGSARPIHPGSVPLASVSAIEEHSPFSTHRDQDSLASTSTFPYTVPPHPTDGQQWASSWVDPISDSSFNPMPQPGLWAPSNITTEEFAGCSNHRPHDRRPCIHTGQLNEQETSHSQLQYDHDSWPAIVPQELMQFSDMSRTMHEEDKALWERYGVAFKSPDLQQLAFLLSKQPWVQKNQEEPSIQELSQAGFLLESVLPQAADSVFEAFHKRSVDQRSVEYHCMIFDDGKQCSNKFQRRERATAHARSHFDYMPFACNGQCDSAQCDRRYTCQALLNDHRNRSKNPKRKCDECYEVVTCQNLSRHMDKHRIQVQPTTAKEKKKITPLIKLRTNTTT